MSEEKECNQVLKGLCNCKCVKNGTYPCFIEKEFLLKQQLQIAKEENEKLKERNKYLEQVHKVDTHFCTAFINLKGGLVKILNHYYFTRKEYNLESMCLIPAIQTLVGRLRGKVDKQEKEIELLTQQNKQMQEALNYAITFYKDTLNKKMDIDLGEWIEIFTQALKGVE